MRLLFGSSSHRAIIFAKGPSLIPVKRELRTVGTRLLLYSNSEMATATTVRVPNDVQAQFLVSNISPESVQAANAVLQRNHDDNDIYFNDEGFHNHIVHHILASLALGASASTIQKLFDINSTYQRSPPTADRDVVTSMADSQNFMSHLGDVKQYANYRSLFEHEIEKTSIEAVVNKYLFSGDKRANEMFGRLFAGFLHPVIHLGYGIEFQQPAIIVEALAQAATHSGWMNELLTQIDDEVKDRAPESDSMVNILGKICKDPKLSVAAHWKDPNKIRDGVMRRAKEEMVEYASQWQVKPQEINEKLAEMINGCAYFTGCAQRPDKQVKFDFYLLHCINASIFFPAFMQQSWISDEMKAKLLEWKGRLDLIIYTSRRAPALDIGEIPEYFANRSVQSWQTIFDRAKVYEDDGHTCKFVRALAKGEALCGTYEHRENFMVKGDMWRKLAQMVMDSVDDTGERWVRSAGFDEAWEHYGSRKPGSNL